MKVPVIECVGSVGEREGVVKVVKEASGSCQRQAKERTNDLYVFTDVH